MWALLGNPSRPPRSKGELPPLLLRLTNLLGYLFLILVNVLSSTGSLGGTNAEVSARYPTPLTPSGWAFAIWGLIFALEGLGVIYQIINSGYREGGWKANVVIRIGYGWQLGWLFQDLWQFVFVRENVVGMWLAAAALIAALAAFQFTLHRLNGTTHELRARGYAAMPAAAYAFYKLPTAVNAAWLSVATALGILIVPVSYGVSQAALVAPAAVLTVAVTAGGVWRLLRYRDAAYGLTLIWALSAVASNGSGNVPQAVKVVGIICLVVLALCVVSALVRTHRAHSAATAAAAADAAAGAGGGSLLSDPFSSYGLYGDQRTLLSDPDAPAGCQRTSSGSFTFPELAQRAGGGSGSGSGNGHSFHRAAPAEGVAVIVALGNGAGGGAGSGGLKAPTQLALVGGAGSREGTVHRISLAGGVGGGANGVGSGAGAPVGASRQSGQVPGS
ncbi:hypothetical protein PLESTB_000166000 [Pleodorina starrii]|uniref:Uncharacterized protein n=1 Tax=Pleodorina starrii TaxID=330485 RepID=A0A9W6BBA7_9CHLO|nr:hypothetical protein PLESTM_002065600 [Pleodorina starrii]GLC48947.1 hypothetical protein PLESTB_000166000 [Pleodorina starrii]GLC72676.1 hypothetical protein PLESTF_001277400 [Pleodorina starrii]